MSFEDTQKELYERAARIEEMEGTIKLVYKEEQEDLKNYFLSIYEPLIIVLSIFAVALIAFFIKGLVENDLQEISAGIGLVLLLLILGIIVAKNKKFIKSRDEKRLCEMILSFNSYGIVLRACSELAHSTYVYEWSEFDQITEYSKILIGMSKGAAFLFPKRVFSEEEFNIFRRFSYAAINKKCIYKKFKP